MIELENDLFVVKVKEHGAELCSAWSKQNKIEYMWSADPAHWGRVSPILFPIVGALGEGAYVLDGVKYKMPKHGFLREQTFAVKSRTADTAKLIFSSNEETMKCFPFSFDVVLAYTLDKNKLILGWHVKNKGSQKMFFSIGGHPAFRVPLLDGEAFEDYTILIRPKKNAKEYEFDSKLEFIQEKGEITNCEIQLRQDTFVNDALIFSKVDETVLANKNGTRAVRIVLTDFPFVGFWSKYHTEQKKSAPFVCIEPWFGMDDLVEHDGDFKNKFGIQSLEAGEIFSASYEIFFE